MYTEVTVSQALLLNNAVYWLLNKMKFFEHGYILFYLAFQYYNATRRLTL